MEFLVLLTTSLLVLFDIGIGRPVAVELLTSDPRPTTIGILMELLVGPTAETT